MPSASVSGASPPGATGQCSCGAVGFEIWAPLSDIYVCHCSICRRSTGSNGIALVIVDNNDFAWTRGEDQIRRWDKPNADWHSWFCGTCGAKVPGINDPSRMFVPAALLDSGDDNLTVRHHIWVDSRAHWDHIGDSGQQHPEAFGTGE